MRRPDMTDERKMVDFSNDKTYRKFNIVYKKALDKNAEVFVFDDSDFVIGYAKYLLEYINNLRKAKKMKIWDLEKKRWIL